MRENAKEMDALTREGAENRKNMNAVEHMKFHGQVTELQAEQLQKGIHL